MKCDKRSAAIPFFGEPFRSYTTACAIASEKEFAHDWIKSDTVKCGVPEHAEVAWEKVVGHVRVELEIVVG
jgi:hypothetical protein